VQVGNDTTTYVRFITGIQCYNRLDDILKLVNTQVVQRDSKYVIQKYIG